MSDSEDRTAPIESRDQLIGELSRGIKPKSQWMIGTEHEKFPFYSKDVSPVPYEGERGIGALLQGLLDCGKGYEGMYEGETLIGLKKPTCCGQFSASITLEPGGQFELSGAPFQSVHETKAEIADHLYDACCMADDLGIKFLGLGYSPKFTVDESPRMPKGRYDIMRAYMPKVGTYGLNMMHSSSTVQVNLDFGSEEDMVKKFRVGLALQPLATALFANSVFKDGKLNGFHSFRSEVWRDVDGDRTGMLPFVFEEGMGFDAYVSYALDVPMYFVYRDGKYIDGKGQSFSKFLEGKFDGLPGELPTLADWETHLTTLFPEVRLKQFLEMRGADCGPVPFLSALSAFWTGIFYDGSCLDAAEELIMSWSAEQRQTMRDNVPKMGMKTPVTSTITMVELAREVLSMASSGLKSREMKNEAGSDERIFIEPLLEIAEDGWAQSDRLIDRFKTVWDEDISKVYEEMAYEAPDSKTAD